jgi:hypothetical protein
MRKQGCNDHLYIESNSRNQLAFSYSSLRSSQRAVPKGIAMGSTILCEVEGLFGVAGIIT